VESQTTETEFTVLVDFNNDSIKANIKNASISHVIQAIAFLIDQASSHNPDIAQSVADLIPDVMKKYNRMKYYEVSEENLEYVKNDVLRQFLEDNENNDNVDIVLYKKAAIEMWKRRAGDKGREDKEKPVDSEE